MRCADGGIRQFTDQPAMDSALLVTMSRRIRLKLQRRRGFTDGDDTEPQ